MQWSQNGRQMDTPRLAMDKAEPSVQGTELPLVRWTGGLGRRSASGLRFVLHGRPVAERRMSPA